MRIDRLQAARREAKRFLDATVLVTERPPYEFEPSKPSNKAVAGRAAAAVKRASLDLTMALAKLRTDKFA